MWWDADGNPVCDSSAFANEQLFAYNSYGEAAYYQQQQEPGLSEYQYFPTYSSVSVGKTAVADGVALSVHKNVFRLQQI